MNDKPVLVKTDVAAAMLGVSKRTLHNWAISRADVRACKFTRNQWRRAMLESLGGAR